MCMQYLCRTMTGVAFWESYNSLDAFMDNAYQLWKEEFVIGTGYFWTQPRGTI